MNRYKRQGGMSPVGIIIVLILIVGGMFLFTKNREGKEVAQGEKQKSDGVEKPADIRFSPSPQITPKPPGTTSISPSPQKSLAIKLNEEQGSRLSGETVLTDANGKTKIIITLTGKTPTGSMPSHIHNGICPALGDVRYSLTNVVNGKSETLLDIPLADITKNLPFAINIHKSATEILSYIACGSLGSQGGGTAPVADPSIGVKTDSVSYTSSGFVPNTVEITRGQKVTFSNETSGSFWVASNDHPTHTLYSAFDQGRSLGKGGVYSFTFTEAGTWKYHNHNNSAHRGTVIVK